MILKQRKVERNLRGMVISTEYSLVSGTECMEASGQENPDENERMGKRDGGD